MAGNRCCGQHIDNIIVVTYIIVTYNIIDTGNIPAAARWCTA